MSDDGGAAARVAAELARSRKYRFLAPELLARVAKEALAGGGRAADAVKRAKRALHQLHSAFVEERELAAAERALDRFAPEAGDAALRATCEAVLRCHASTRERALQLEALGRELRRRLGAVASVVDVGCGLQPFALPWLGLARDVPYHAIEADARMAALVERFFARIGQAGSVAVVDLAGEEHGDDATLPRADVALLFKLLPTLERQRAGAAGRLLDRLDVRAAVLSFPTRSLGAREKGMARNYESFARELLAARGWPADQFELGSELFVVTYRRGEKTAEESAHSARHARRQA